MLIPVYVDVADCELVLLWGGLRFHSVIPALRTAISTREAKRTVRDFALATAVKSETANQSLETTLRP